MSWTSSDYWSYWRSALEKAKGFERRARAHTATHTASGKEKKPCEKCQRAKDMGFGGCDYYWDQLDKAEKHGNSAAGYKHGARALEVEEGKPITIDGTKTQEEYNRELREEQERKWAALDEEEHEPEPVRGVPAGMQHWLVSDNER
jgi:hypothetical protein